MSGIADPLIPLSSHDSCIEKLRLLCDDPVGPLFIFV